MAIIVESPNEVYSLENRTNKKIFIAGGIANCPDWQTKLIEKLKDVKGITLYNPRRKDFPMDDPYAAEEQITWEYNHLRDADHIIFWFSRGSLNPMVLYELGMWGNSPISKSNSLSAPIIGIDPEYERKLDVIIQTKLSFGRFTPQIFDSIDDIAEFVKVIV